MTFPSTIQAIVLKEQGDFDVIQKVEVPFPTPAPDQILVKAVWGGINFIDNYFRTGIYPVSSWPARFGEEVSGTIVALPSDPAVLGDPEYQKRGFVLGGRVVLQDRGVLAEYATAHWQKVYPIPNNVDLLVGVAAAAQGLTALAFSEEAYEIKSGDVVFIHTVAGGFGLLLTQIAKLRGATVIGTTSTSEKAAVAKDRGADHVILYKDEDVVRRVLEITNGEGVHASFDGVGKDGVEIDFQIIRRKGTIVFVGNASGVVPPIPPLRLAPKNITICRPILGNYMFTPAESTYYSTKLYDLISQGKLDVGVHKIYPFTSEGVQQAERDLTGGKSIGKLVIKVADE